jgi:hypothetical protein
VQQNSPEQPQTLSDLAGRALLRDPIAATPEWLVVRVVVLLVLVNWTWSLTRASIESNAVGASFLHLIDLPFHEAGHVIFMPLGQFLMALGGSLMQLIVPGALTAVFLTRHRDPFGAAVTSWWFGENLLDLAPYINDARNLSLVLLGGRTGAEVEGHDWEYILMSLGWLHHDHMLAKLAHFFGSLIMFVACAWALTLIIRQWRARSTET